MELPDVRTADVENKKVLLRLDLDVGLNKNGQIEEDLRLLAGLDSLKLLLQKKAQVYLIGHLGRPEGREQSLTLKPVVKWYENQFKVNPPAGELKFKAGMFDGWRLSDSLFILENLRFFEGEEKNDFQFAESLAGLAQVYVNDAFGVCHRNHASIVGIPKILPHYAGLRLQKETEVLGSVLKNPKRPLVVIIGGGKIETKLGLVEKMHHFADYVLVGGKVACQKGELIKMQHEQLSPRQNGKKSILLVGDITGGKEDITTVSVENFLEVVNSAATVVWNGPMGIINQGEETEEGTKALAQGIIQSHAYTIIGGGDTISFLKRMGVLDRFSFVSTGGGAMLAFLSGEKLPGIEALMRIANFK